MVSSVSESSDDPDPLSSGVCGLLSGGILVKDDGSFAQTLREAGNDGYCCSVGVIVPGIFLTIELNNSG